MRAVSVCSGVGGLDLGLHRAGHRTVALCEADPFRRRVLARHWPGVPIYHDLMEIAADDLPECDILVGGTPCQDLSVAGKRAGLDGTRSGLFWRFAQLRIDLYERHGCVLSLWENVAGALSSNAGGDFAQVLAAHVGADVTVPSGGWRGHGVAVGPWGAAEWRLLDAQFFGVPQRRRRVFVVGHLAAECAPKVLSEPEGSGRDSAARGEARTHAPTGASPGAGSACRVSHKLTSGSHNGRPPGRRREDDVNLSDLAALADSMRAEIVWAVDGGLLAAFEQKLADKENNWWAYSDDEALACARRLAAAETQEGES
jgi:DNA (cytosine-5)-methyltransferase 1